MRIASGVMLAVFLLSVAVQLNDPDPIRWIVLYGIAAVLSGLALKGRYFFWATAAACAVYLAGLAVLWEAGPATSPEAFSGLAMRNAEHEQVREFWGLVLCLSWCGVLLVKSRASGDQPNEVEP